MLHSQILGPWYFHIIEHSPRNWKTTVCQNVALTVFHTQIICHHAWKTHRTTLWCIFALQSRGDGLKSTENYETDLFHSFLYFMTFSLQLETNNAFQYSSDSFPRMVIFILCVESFQNYILRIFVSQLQGDYSIMWENFMDTGSESWTYLLQVVSI